eukprot:CAMPEP_0180807420 /NCGR_PEP_ID=MMETSP1038_2-20121128/63235_1 /TAXON_ID=632150 /ORGANISM="Azadinium spinosum, Strain 3D9" /LENGTH=204 /DNA_ID=CAMNT_0022848429 /DNA_START=1 /DNA_END=612 /DNA_ORIENTATION=-
MQTVAVRDKLAAQMEAAFAATLSFDAHYDKGGFAAQDLSPWSPASDVEAESSYVALVKQRNIQLEAELEQNAQLREELQSDLVNETAAAMDLHRRLATTEQAGAASAFPSSPHGSQTSELRVELACVTRMRDAYQSDLLDEASVAAKLRQQLEAAQSTCPAGLVSSSDAQRLRNRNTELESELARTARVRDKIQLDLAEEAAMA